MIDYDKRDWYKHLFAIEGSMIREIMGRVLICVVGALIVVIGHKLKWSIGIPSTPFTLVGVVLGLLLVFRTNASYDRYWEGRRQWGCIINEARNLARAARVYLKDAPDLVATVIAWNAVFPHAAMNGLRGTRGLGPSVTRLPQPEVQATLLAQHVPLAVATRITEALVTARDRGLISDYVMLAIDQNVQLLIDYLGACERIHKTPLPFVYVVHLRRALFIYCLTLPLALIHDFGWWTVPVVLIISYMFLGIEEIGVEIEDPFGHDINDLPLERFCDNIEREVFDVLATLPVKTVDGDLRAEMTVENRA